MTSSPPTPSLVSLNKVIFVALVVMNFSPVLSSLSCTAVCLSVHVNCHLLQHFFFWGGKTTKRKVGKSFFFPLFGQMSEVLGTVAFQGRRISATWRSSFYTIYF